MHRTQLYLENHQYLLLKDWASKQKKSIAQLVRELVDAALKHPAKNLSDPLNDLVGTADSGYSNISRNADAYLYGDERTLGRLEREGLVRDAPSRRKKRQSPR